VLYIALTLPYFSKYFEPLSFSFPLLFIKIIDLKPKSVNVRILACKPDKIKGNGYDKMRNETHKNLRGSPNLAMSTGKYRRILLSNVGITTSLK